MPVSRTNNKHKTAPVMSRVNGNTYQPGWAYHPTKGWRKVNPWGYMHGHSLIGRMAARAFITLELRRRTGR